MDESAFDEAQIDWRGMVRSRCETLGFDSLTSLLEFYSDESYTRLGERLETVPVNIYVLQFEEAKNHGRIRDAVKDSFVRHVNGFFPDGWDNSQEAEFKRAGAVSDPVADAKSIARLGEYIDRIRAVANLLFTKRIPDGWRPKNIEDPIIEEAFDNGWPIKDV